MKPGAFQIVDGYITLNEEREKTELSVKNTGSRSVQVGSHFHLAEANRALLFDRKKAIGMRLDIPSGTSVRIEPGEERKVTLTAIGGRKTVRGFNGLADGCMDERGRQKTIERLHGEGWIEGVVK
ncbi:urease subunit beta [Bacillus swezeyi]|uniref:urease subunit beta n=1 Tax=Bacillus swezeyi TaxID=1925020 RepID=UPI0027DE0359|nr:urease subunit beta [Bacillus swezeyi]